MSQTMETEKPEVRAWLWCEPSAEGEKRRRVLWRRGSDVPGMEVVCLVDEPGGEIVVARNRLRAAGE